MTSHSFIVLSERIQVEENYVIWFEKITQSNFYKRVKSLTSQEKCKILDLSGEAQNLLTYSLQCMKLLYQH